MTRLLAVVYLLALPLLSASRACLGSLPVGTFRLLVAPASGGPALPVRSVNAIRAGQKLQYQPVNLTPDTKEKAQIALVLVPAAGNGAQDLTIFDPTKAAAPASWTAPHDVTVVALIFGPQGLSVKKLKSLVDKNEEVLSELADYAEQNSKVEGLIEAIATSEQSGGNLNAALSGFSAKYGVAMPKLDTRAGTDQQAGVLLQALLPAMNSYDPLSPRQAVMQQSVGLAASVAGMFFGSPVGLAAGGAALFQNMHTLMFPGMEFRSAFTQPSGDGLAMCTKAEKAKSRTRMAYLWALRVPNLGRPAPALAGEAHAPLGARSLIRLREGSGVKGLERVREWQLVPSGSGAPVTVPVTAQGQVLDLDLTKVKAAPGQYTLTELWDWDRRAVPGALWLHRFGDLKQAKLSARSQDRLAEGNGTVPVTLEGADFQFVEKVAVEKAGPRQAAPAELLFTLPKGKRGGVQGTLETDIDTRNLSRGAYRMLLAQGDGLTYEVPFQVLPPNPKISNTPLRANAGENEVRLTLRGTGLERIEGLTSEGGAFELDAPSNGGERTAVFRLAPCAKKGDRFAVSMKVQGVGEPVEVPGALEVVGPRPRIAAVQKSLAQEETVALRPGETPAGTAASFALSVEHLEGVATLEVSCAGEQDLRKKITLAPGDRQGGAKLDMAGEGILFLSLDPGSVGQPGCRLTASVATEAAGRSEPTLLGQVVRVPRITQFVLTDEKLADGVYAGILKGQDLETVEKAGWDTQSGTAVRAIPTPAPGDPGKQVLRIALPWPAPAPHAPVYVWLRGEQQGRATGAKY